MAVEMMFVRQMPFQKEITIVSERVELPPTGFLCEVALARNKEGGWTFVRKWKFLCSNEERNREISEAEREAEVLAG